MSEQSMNNTSQSRKSQMLVLMLILSLALSHGQSLCQASGSAPAKALVEKMIKAQLNYDYVTIDNLDRQFSELDRPPVVELDRQASHDANELLQQEVHATSNAERLQKLSQYAGALRKGRGVSNELLHTDMLLGSLDTLKNDCYFAFSTSRHRSDSDCWLWYWLGLAYAVEGDDKKSVACFTIGLRKSHTKDGNLAAESFGNLYQYIIDNSSYPSIPNYPAAHRDFQQAQKEIEAEQNDRMKLKYGG